jgi:protein-S-isoprenylcysteine O-methyltransferase Ste14
MKNTPNASLIFLYVPIALAVLYRWGAPDPWSRVDSFSGAVLLGTILVAAEQIAFSRAVSSDDARGEALGMTFDPGLAKWGGLLGFLELGVFLEYGHWNLAPALEKPVLQYAGLILYSVALVWLRWVDATLVRNFNSDASRRRLLASGPFLYIRHPRYAGLIATRIAMALAMASVVGWACLAGWVWIIRRRVTREEPHLVRCFGEEYVEYAKRTWRVLPGVY